jgi:hypothetical protein
MSKAKKSDSVPAATPDLPTDEQLTAVFAKLSPEQVRQLKADHGLADGGLGHVLWLPAKRKLAWFKDASELATPTAGAPQA